MRICAYLYVGAYVRPWRRCFNDCVHRVSSSGKLTNNCDPRVLMHSFRTQITGAKSNNHSCIGNTIYYNTPVYSIKCLYSLSVSTTAADRSRKRCEPTIRKLPCDPAASRTHKIKQINNKQINSIAIHVLYYVSTYFVSSPYV